MSGNLFDGLTPEAAKAADSAKAPGSGQTAAGWFTAHCDGGSRGNPGPAGFGAVIEDPRGQIVARLSEFLGKHTNNYAEYSGLLAVLKWAAAGGARRLRVVSDSELMVKQMKGQYKVSNPGLRPLWEEARRLARTLDAFDITHTLRAGNAEADRLANEAMDRGMGKSREQGSGNRDQGNWDRAIPPGINRLAGPPGGARGPVEQAQNAQTPKAQRQVLEGYVKDGVVHLLGGELPDGIFVKVIRD